MADVHVASGVSWLKDKLIQILEERVEFLKEGIAEGVPLHEYQAMVGRYKEAKRQLSVHVVELFEEFEILDEMEEDDGLEELDNE